MLREARDLAAAELLHAKYRRKEWEIWSAQSGMDLSKMEGPEGWASQTCSGFVAWEMCATIFGATRLAQLKHILKGTELRLSDDVLSEIDDAHHSHPMPY